MKLRKEVKEITILILLFALLILMLGAMSKGDKKAVETCTKQTGDRAFCEREYYSVE